MNHFKLKIDPETKEEIDESEDKKCFGRKKTAAKSEEIIEIKELGGFLAQNWHQYLAACENDTKVAFLVDSSDLSQLSSVGFHLINTLEKVKKLLIIYSKIDAVFGKNVDDQIRDIENALRLHHLKENYKIKTLKLSTFDLKGIQDFHEWILSG